MNMIIKQLKELVHNGTVIPKPDAKADFVVKCWGKRRGENALIYFIPNHNKPNKPYQKGITESEWRKAYQQIINTGIFSREWFNNNMQSCNEEGTCNFTTIGGIFELVGIAVHERGIYRKKR